MKFRDPTALAVGALSLAACAFVPLSLATAISPIRTLHAE